MPEVSEIIHSEITEKGYITIADFMEVALYRSDCGYYMKKDPFGSNGDFITAPEISQLFGEMIAIWLVNTWIGCDRPDSFILLECGGGRGTMMSDILRSTGKIRGFHESLTLHMLECSPVLKASQRERLNPFSPIFHEHIETIPHDLPIFIIGNEFFDALPFHQLVKDKTGWKERVITKDNKNHLTFTTIKAEEKLLQHIPELDQPAKTGDVLELSPQRTDFMKKISQRLKKQGGAALFIDYGYKSTTTGDSFQAVNNHRYIPVFEKTGKSDLTSHVDFGTLRNTAKNNGLFTPDIITQSEFLQKMGIMQRAKNLKAKATQKQKKDIEIALYRLLSENEMGSLFKAMEIYSKQPPEKQEYPQ